MTAPASASPPAPYHPQGDEPSSSPTVAATTLAASLGGGGGAIPGGARGGTALAPVGYVAIFLGLGLLVRRARAWGLAYILIWEGAVSRVARGAARLSIQVYARSVFA